MNNKCAQCGKELDLLGMFTEYQVCKTCVSKNHKIATGKLKELKRIKKQGYGV